MIEHRISEDEAGQRVDKLVRRLLPDVPLSGIYKLIRTKKVRVNGKRTRNEYLLQPGDVLAIRAAASAPSERTDRPRPPPRPAKLPAVRVLYEDDALLAVDKPAGLAVHPGSGVTGITLVDWARLRLGTDPASLEFKPSPAHRLDRETSGVILIARKRQAMVRLTEIFTEGLAHKTYLALAQGRMPRPQGTIDVPLAEHQQTARSREARGVNLQEAITHYRVIASAAGASLLECTIETGRTHQIRRHLAAIGHPIAGDAKYGDFPWNRELARTLGLKRQFLHARRLELDHPLTGRPLVVEAPLPADLAAALGASGIRWTSPRPRPAGAPASVEPGPDGA